MATKRYGSINRICTGCGIQFKCTPSAIRTGGGKFCTRVCASSNQPRKPLRERLLSFLDIKGEDDCWEFNGYLNDDGYGIIRDGNRRLTSAHRASYILHTGEKIPEGKMILHSCDNRRCCNPKHLRIGTNDDNMKDMVKRGRSRCLRGANSPRASLTQEEVDFIRSKFTGKRGEALSLSKEFNIPHSTMWRMLARKAYK